MASPPEGPRHTPVHAYYSKNSLKLPWHGLVWMNPPFGHQKDKILWLTKFFEHGNGVALVPDRTSAPWWQTFAKEADAICFMSPKVKFERPDGSLGKSPGTGTCLFSSGVVATRAILQSNLGLTLCNTPK